MSRQVLRGWRLPHRVQHSAREHHRAQHHEQDHGAQLGRRRHCFGVFTRGTYGAVRTFTDFALRESNEAYLQDRFTDLDDFWMVIRVPVSSALTVTPNLSWPYTRLVEWPPNPAPATSG